MNPIIICLGIGVPLLIFAVLFFGKKNCDSELDQMIAIQKIRNFNEEWRLFQQIKEEKRQSRLKVAKRKALRR